MGTNGSSGTADVTAPESTLEEYTPAAGRRFRASDSDAEFVGDGTRWHYVQETPLSEGSIEASAFSSVTPAIRSGPHGFATISHDVRSRLVSYEAGYTKPVFHWSFDGGATNNYEFRQLFEDLGTIPTLAISPSVLDEEGKMSWSQLRELQSRYGWGVSNHGHRHDRFDEMGPEDQEREVVDAIAAFSRHGVVHNHYMYSWGMAGGEVGRSVVANLYPYAWGTVHAPEAEGIVDVDSPYGLPRVLVEREDRAELEAAIDRAIANETGMVLFGHNIFQGESVDENGFETSVERIEHLTEYVRSQGGEWVDSVDEVVQYSRTPVSISAGSEPLRTNEFVAEAVTTRSLAVEEVGVAAYQSTAQQVDSDEPTGIAFDSTRHDHRGEFDSEDGTIALAHAGTYAIAGTVHLDAGREQDGEMIDAGHEQGGEMTLRLVVDDDTEAQSVAPILPFSSQVSGSVHTHLQLRDGRTVGLEVLQTTGESLRTLPGPATVYLSVTQLG